MPVQKKKSDSEKNKRERIWEKLKRTNRRQRPALVDVHAERVLHGNEHPSPQLPPPKRERNVTKNARNTAETERRGEEKLTSGQRAKPAISRSVLNPF